MQIFRELRGLRELTSKNTLLQKNTGSISKGAIAAIEIHLFFSRTIIFFVHLPKVIYQCSMSHIFSWNGARHTYLITRKHYTQPNGLIGTTRYIIRYEPTSVPEGQGTRILFFTQPPTFLPWKNVSIVNISFYT